MIDIRDTVGKRDVRNITGMKRKHLITRQDCYNIARKTTFQATRRHDNDAISVCTLITELRQESYNPVLLYKPQGERFASSTSIAESCFIAAFQTEFQREIYERYASTILCVDSTHCTTAYGFKLITLLVSDNFNEGLCV